MKKPGRESVERWHKLEGVFYEKIEKQVCNGRENYLFQFGSNGITFCSFFK